MDINSSALAPEMLDDIGLFKRLFDAMPQLSWTATPDGSIDFYNQGWYEFTGTTFSESRGMGWEMVHHPEHLPNVKEKFKSALAAGASFELEFPMRRHDGVFEWFLTKVNPLKDENGQVTRWIGINSNIQALKEKEALLESSERRIVTLANALPNFVWSTDRELNADFFNDRWYQYTGLTPDTSLGQGWRQCFAEDMLEAMDSDWAHAIATKSPYSAEQQIRSKDGEYRWFLTKGYPMLDESGDIVSWFGTNTDIEEQKKASDSLEKIVAERTRLLKLEKDKAIAANKAKSNLVATISHEIRNPLSGVIGLLELIVKEQDPHEAKVLAVGALSASQTLHKILNDLLDASKLNAGKLQLEKREFSVAEVIDNVCVLMKSNADKKSLSLQLNVSKSLPKLVLGDELRVSQIISNLLSNAIKFTDAGYVAINCNAKQSDDDTFMVFLEVEDSGIGIDEDKLTLLFQPYSQLEPSTSRVFGGTGLGLNISANLVELMGGRIGVKSSPGSGSKFWVELPFKISR